MISAGEVLPHRYPFLLLDAVEIKEENKAGRGIKRITGTEPYVQDGGTLSHVFVVEAMAQLSGIVSGRKGGGVLAGIKEMEFVGQPKAGQSLTIESRCEGTFGGLYIFYCEAQADESLCARGKVILQLF